MRGGDIEGLVGALTAIAAAAEASQSPPTMPELLEQARCLAERLASEAGAAKSEQLAKHLQTVAETWHRVWPRLGRQRDFRLAVAREARRWSQELLTIELAS